MQQVTGKKLLVKSWIYPIILVATILVIDQVSKFMIRMQYPSLVIVNQRGVWGIMPAWFSLIGLVALTVWIQKQKQVSLMIWGILAAGLSNLLDRLLYNGVIDWIHSFSWFPVFNMADIVITGGVGVLLIQELLSKNKLS